MELETFVRDLKPFSKIFIFGSLVVSILLMMKILSANWFVLFVPADLLNPLKYISSIFLMGKLSMNNIMELLFFYYTANSLEKTYLPQRYGEFLYMLGFVFIGNHLIMIPLSWNGFLIVRKALTLSLTYIFCRKFPNTKITVFFIIKLKAIYFIWFQLFMTVMEERFIYSLSALLVGHSYYFIKDILPVTHRIHWLSTPVFMNKLATKVLALMDEKGDLPRG